MPLSTLFGDFGHLCLVLGLLLQLLLLFVGQGLLDCLLFSLFAFLSSTLITVDITLPILIMVETGMTKSQFSTIFKKVCFHQMHNHGLRQLFLTVS